MKGPYQIRREKRAEGWHFTLYRFEKGKAKRRVLEGDNDQPITPKWMARVQVRLNSRAVLDQMRIT